MLEINLDENKSILYLKPHSALKAEDFLQLTAIVDTYLKQHGTLKGVVVEAITFPGWENIKAFIAHVKFIKNHHTKVQKIALVTDSKLADLARICIGFFVKPQLKHFPYGQETLATQWVEQ